MRSLSVVTAHALNTAFWMDSVALEPENLPGHLRLVSCYWSEMTLTEATSNVLVI